jgi:hypothetical protein
VRWGLKEVMPELAQFAGFKGRQPRAMRNASSDVLLAFLRNFKEWRGTSDRGDDLRLGATMRSPFYLAIGRDYLAPAAEYAHREMAQRKFAKRKALRNLAKRRLE